MDESAELIEQLLREELTPKESHQGDMDFGRLLAVGLGFRV